MLARPRICALLLTLLAVAGCGGGGSDSTPASETSSATGRGTEHATGGGGLEHIHGLSLRGRTLDIATHTGLWSVAEGGGSPRLVGHSRQDLMGFAAARPGEFLASGHPAPDQTSMPPNLGLIRSRDGGRTWTPVSLLGKADFHALEVSGRRVYGFDGTQGRLMTSTNGGETWQQREPPAAIFDLAVDPRQPQRVVAATEAGLVASSNGAVDWLQLRDDISGLIAWPQRDRFYLVGGNGTVGLSTNGGRDWRAVGSVGGRPVAFVARGRTLYVALDDSSVKRSNDGGRTWTTGVAPR